MNFKIQPLPFCDAQKKYSKFWNIFFVLAGTDFKIIRAGCKRRRRARIIFFPLLFLGDFMFGKKIIRARRISRSKKTFRSSLGAENCYFLPLFRLSSFFYSSCQNLFLLIKFSLSQ